MRQASLARLSSAALTMVVGALFTLTPTSTASAATFHVSTTTQLEEAVATANGNAQANTIELAGGEVYLPAKSLLFTDTSGVQSLVGPAGLLTTESPEAKLEGTNVQEVTGVSGDELINVAKSVTLNLNHVIITTAGRGGSAAVEVFGTLNVENSTIGGNLTTGVVIQPKAVGSFVNSTISDGLSEGVADGGTATFQNDTVVRNTSTGIGGKGHASLTNTIIAENGAPQCGALIVTTNDHNLASDESCGAEFKNVSPILSTTLENDGGSTTVHSELPGSPTIAHGDAAHCPATDQRGFTRPAAECDIGADQYSNKPPVLTVPPHVLKEEAAGAGAAAVSYTVEGTDPDGLVKTIECSPKSGASFAVGTTKVNCTATDDHENQATKSFEVTLTEASTGITGFIQAPGGEAVNSAGDIWVAEWRGNAVNEYNPSGSLIGSVSVEGPCTGSLSGPWGLAIDSEGNLWVANSKANDVLEFSATTGACKREVGTAGTGNGQFAYPTSVAVAPSGNIWVSDMGNQRIQQFTKTGAFVKAIGTPGTFGSGHGELDLPEGVAVDKSGNLWISEPMNARVQELSETGTFLGQVSARAPEAQSVALDPANGNMWIADGSNTVREVNASRELLLTLGSAGSGEGQLTGPDGVTVDANGNVWVGDHSPKRVEKWTKAG